MRGRFPHAGLAEKGKSVLVLLAYVIVQRALRKPELRGLATKIGAVFFFHPRSKREVFKALLGARNEGL